MMEILPIGSNDKCIIFSACVVALMIKSIDPNLNKEGLSTNYCIIIRLISNFLLSSSNLIPQVKFEDISQITSENQLNFSIKASCMPVLWKSKIIEAFLPFNFPKFASKATKLASILGYLFYPSQQGKIIIYITCLLWQFYVLIQMTETSKKNIGKQSNH